MAESPKRCDVVVIGGGILGLAVARELLSRHPDSSLRAGAGGPARRPSDLPLERRHPRRHLLRPRLAEGAAAWRAPGCSTPTATSAASRPRHEGKHRGGGRPRPSTLDELERRGQENQVPGLRRLAGGEIAEIEPHARGVAALHSPETGVVDFTRVAASYARDVEGAGGTVVTGAGVRGLTPHGETITVEHERGTTEAGFVVSCAGAWSDRLAVAAGAPAEPRIVPFRGGYLRLRPERRDLVRASIYPVPDPDLPFLGGHLTRTIDGEVLLGPSALMVGARDARACTVGCSRRGRSMWAIPTWPGTWRLMGHFWRTGLTEIRHAASKRSFVSDLRRFVPELSVSDVLPGPSGIRAQALDRDGKLVDDFVVHRTERALHVRNAPSPAATSSLALAKLIVDEADEVR
jgi:2-hydroxyglutarate dehydrogenase